MKNAVKKIAALVMAVAMLATCALAAVPGTIDLDAKAEGISKTAYSVTYTAKLVMPDELAAAAAAVFPDARLFDMVFVCNLNDALVAQLQTVEESDVTFDGGDIFEFVDITADATDGITVKYQLNEDLVTAWDGYDVAQVKAALKAEMTMTATKTATVAQVDAALAVSDPVATTAEITIEGEFGTTGYQSGFTAAQGTAELEVIPYTSGGGLVGGDTGSSDKDVKSEYAINVVNADNGSVSADYSKAEAGTLVTITVSPADGYRITALSVKTNSGTDVAVVKKNENVFTFYMPAAAVVVSSEFAPAIADPASTGVDAYLIVDDHIVYMNGYPEGDFRPNGNITRAEVCQVFYNLMKDKTYEDVVTFADVDQNQWYAAAINKLFDMKIVNGVSATKFEPNRAITRAELAAIVSRFANVESNYAFAFADVSVNHWAYKNISTAAGFGWIKGVGNNKFEPDRPITRAEAATLVNHMLGRIADKAAIDAGQAKTWIDVSASHWARYEIAEATEGHDHSFNDARTVETWIEE